MKHIQEWRVTGSWIRGDIIIRLGDSDWSDSSHKAPFTIWCSAAQPLPLTKVGLNSLIEALEEARASLND